MGNNLKKIIAGLLFSVIIISGIYIGINKDNFKEEISVNVSVDNEDEVLLSSLDRDNQNNYNRNSSDNINNDNQSNNDEEIRKLEEILNNPFFILINKENRLSEDYTPDNLKLSEVEFLDYIETRQLESTTADALKEMFDSALQDGVILLGASGYRSYNVQKNLYYSRVSTMGEEKTNLYTAQPGASEHQTGLAIDILSSEYQNLDEGFENSKAFEWLINNCYKYGFILRYLDGKEDITGYNYEPWHFRYIGNKEIAKEIMDRGIVFEEYIAEMKDKLKQLKDNN